ncbi:MAG: sigma-70 family RNA polymerase sigma factor [Planctomycetaceae bacterium]|nr:sigma-70 family RNA polymerase sigma factor [Planctomycetaceae bacterium]
MNVISPEIVSLNRNSSATAEFERLNDADLLDAWNQDQHRGALETLVQRYSQMVLGVCRRRCRTHADADDAFQTTFLYLARNSKKIRQPDRLVGWLHRVAQRAALATLPSKERETSPMVEPPAPSDDPLKRLTQRHEAIILDEELADLPDHYRSAIVMHVCEGQSIEHLAKKLETTAGSIRGRLQRGKQLLATRLRRRGVIPALAYATAQAWTIPEAVAREAATDFVAGIGEFTPLPDPPIQTSLLESCLANGLRSMPSFYTLAGITGGSILVALLMVSNGIGDSPNGQQVTLPASKPGASQAAFNVTVVPQQAVAQPLDQVDRIYEEATASSTQATPDASPIGLERAMATVAKSNTAVEANAALSKRVNLTISGTLEDLPAQIAKVAGVPVLLDNRGIAFAKFDPTQSIEKLVAEDIPLRTALRMLLNPLGLKATVESEGLVITADPAVLVHQGIGTTRWINIDPEAEAKIARALDSESTMNIIALPLIEAINVIQETHSIQIAIDLPALEDIGLSATEPVTTSLKQVKLRSVLKTILSPMDLTYTIRDDILVITANLEAEQELNTRIYWLEGTGFAANDFDSIINALQTSVAPATWEAVGGPASIAPLTTIRPAIMVSTLYPIHETIDEFFEALRETHFGAEPIRPATERSVGEAVNPGVQPPFSETDGRKAGGMF